MAAGIGIISAVLAFWFPHGFGKAMILAGVIGAFVCIAFNLLCLSAVLFLLAGGILGMIASPEME